MEAYLNGGKLMSWEYDKGIIIFFGISILFIVFCVVMATRSSKRQKLETTEEQKLRVAKSQVMTRFGVILFFAVLWFASGVLTFSLFNLGLLSGNEVIKLPRVLLVFYDFFGISGGALVQSILSFLVIIWGVQSTIKKRREISESFDSDKQEYF